MRRKILALIVTILLITSGFVYVIVFRDFGEESKISKYTSPTFDTSSDVNDTGMLIDVDYEEIESQLKTYNDTNDIDNDSLDDSYEEIKRRDFYRAHSTGFVLRIIRDVGVGLMVNFWERESNYYWADRSRTFIGGYVTYEF